MQKRTILAILGLLFILSLLVAVGALALTAIGNSLAPLPSNMSINYTAREVDNAKRAGRAKT